MTVPLAVAGEMANSDGEELLLSQAGSNTAIAVTQAIDMLEHDGSFPKSESPFFLLVYASDPHEDQRDRIAKAFNR